MMLYPKPNSVYNLSADVLAIGTDMTADGDVPTFPEDFHDILVEAVLKDELSKMEKLQYSRDAERKFEKRLSELRYFLAKRAYLSRRPVDRFGGLTTKVWPYGVAP
jgi:hypothetical protein